MSSVHTFRRFVMPALFCLFSLGFLLNTKAQTNGDEVEFKLDSADEALSEIYWPFVKIGNSPKLVWEEFEGSKAHDNSDLHAEDWLLSKGTSCKKDFLAPISGTVMFAGQTDLEPKYGYQVVIRSDTNLNFAFRIAHLQENSIPEAIEKYAKVNVGDKLGQVGGTGGYGCHAHIVLYRDLDEYAIGRLNIGEFVMGEQYAAMFDMHANYVSSSPLTFFKGEFFNNRDLAGDSVFSACYGDVNFDWGPNSPVPAYLPREEFSARWQRDIPIRYGKYNIHTTSDDGVRVFLDDEVVIDEWRDQTAASFSVEKDIDNGIYDLKIEYFEGFGQAEIEFGIDLVTSYNHAPVVSDIPDQSINTGEDFAEIDLREYGIDEDLGDTSTLTWEVSGNSELIVNVNALNVVDIDVPEGFLGIEILTFTATDIHGASDSTTAIFEVSQACDYTVLPNNAGHFVWAIDQANSNPDHTTICLPEGSSYPFSTVHNTIFNNVGVGVIYTPITIEGNGATMTRDLGPNVAMRFFSVSPSGDLTINNLVMDRGVTFMGAYGGGAILNHGGNVNINNSIFSNNRTQNQAAGGGAIRNEAGGTMTISNTEFLANYIRYLPGFGWVLGNGGAIMNAGGTIDITDSKFENNLSLDTGGAIYSTGIINITDTEFINNRANKFGGGFQVAAGIVSLERVKLISNWTMATPSGYGEGGGAYVQAGATLNVVDSKLQDNYAENKGGLFMNYGVVNVAQSCISGNYNNAVFASSPILAENNWWGAADGPSGVGPGTGDSVTTGVDYSPFLTSEPGSCAL